MTATQKRVKKDIRRQQEQGMWRSYIRLLFKTKLPWFWLGFLMLLNIGDTTMGLLLPQYTAQVATGVITTPVITGVIVGAPGMGYNLVVKVHYRLGSRNC